MTQIYTPQQDAIQQYLAGLNQTTYIYPFLILQSSDLAVYVTAPGASANPINDLIPSSDYTVTGVGVTGGGTVIFNTAPAQGSAVTVARNMQLSITTQFNDAQTFNGLSLDNAFQRIVLLLQQMQGNYTINAGMVGSISRCLQYAIDTYLPNEENNLLPLLTNMDNQVWISQGGAIVAAVLQNDSLSTLRAQLAINTPTGSGATLIGYYDQNSGTPETLNQYLNTSNIYGLDTGTVNALVLTTLVSSQVTAYQKGMIVRVVVANTNTGASTININGIGVISIYRDSTSPAIAADLVANQTAELIFDGTHFVLMNSEYLYVGADSSVSANTITVSNLYPQLASYIAFYPVLFILIANTNTGATTININGLGAKNITLVNQSALSGGELVAGGIAQLLYDGTQFQLLNPSVVKATNAQVAAGTNNSAFVTPASLASGLSTIGTVASGYATLPGGLIIQWGQTGSIGNGIAGKFTFPKVFPNAILGWSAVPNSSSTSGSCVASADTTGVTATNTTGSVVSFPVACIAIGY